MPVAWEIYRHYKSTGWSDYTYEVIWLGMNRETEEVMVIYKPLYDSINARLGDCKYIVRPLSMWDDDVEYNGNTVKRFTKIG